MTRELLDGPSIPPDDPREYAIWMRQQLQLASPRLFISPLQSREEIWQFTRFSAQMNIEQQKLKLAENRLANRALKEQRQHDLAERRLRLAEIKAETAAARVASRAQAKAEQTAQDRQLFAWYEEHRAQLLEALPKNP